MSQLFHLNSRFKVNHDLKVPYDKFMNEYLTLGHMEIVPEDEIYKENV